MKLIKEIKSEEGVLYFRRWSIFQSKYFSIYIHGIYKEENDLYLHNHPSDFLSIILKGSYIEELENNIFNTRSIFNTTYLKVKNYHKIKKVLKKCFLIAFTVGKNNDSWGYLVNDKHIIHTDYIKKY